MPPADLVDMNRGTPGPGQDREVESIVNRAGLPFSSAVVPHTSVLVSFS